jgi:RNA polymerase sigma-70 factor, ECF subfamily
MEYMQLRQTADLKGLSDEELVRLIQRSAAMCGAVHDELLAGNNAALEELIVRHYDWVTRTCLFELGSREAALECVQEIMLQLTKSIHSFKSKSSLKTWLFVIVQRTARRARQQSSKAQSLLIEKTPAAAEEAGYCDRASEREESIDCAMIISQKNKALLKLIHCLPELQRQAIFLHYFEDLPIAEVASRFGCSDSTVKTHISRARCKLRELINRGNPELQQLFKEAV